jgi:hypothetical protein
VRTFDTALISEIVGADASKLVDDHRNVILLLDNDVGIFAWRGSGIFEGHIHFESRGAGAFRTARAMLDAMQDHARLIWGLTPAHLKHVRLFNRRCGFVSQGLMDTPEGPCELFVKEY